MKTIHVVAAVIVREGKIFATQRGYGDFKDKWEFPGGKVEPGEEREAALKREIREELGVGICVEHFLTTVEYDYPQFHLSMDCFICSLSDGADPVLLEHESAKWLDSGELRSVDWLPADLVILSDIEGQRSRMGRGKKGVSTLGPA